MIVEVETIGQLEFPDNTSKEIIQAKVKELLAQKKQDEPGFMDKYLPSVKRTGEIYQEEVSQGLAAMELLPERRAAFHILPRSI